MTVQEFYDWCKARKITDAEMEISLKFAGLDMSGVKAFEINIDYGKVKLPQGKERKYIRLGGRIMIVYCDADDCKWNEDGKCKGPVQPAGHTALYIRQNWHGWQQCDDFKEKAEEGT